jgi:hypothetical protein
VHFTPFDSASFAEVVHPSAANVRFDIKETRVIQVKYYFATVKNYLHTMEWHIKKSTQVRNVRRKQKDNPDANVPKKRL